MENSQIVAMRKLGMSDEEIAELIEADKRIDKGEKLFELTADQKKTEKKMRQADRKPTVYQLDNANGKRSKKADNDKSYLLECLQRGISEFADIYVHEVNNPEREFEFVYNDRRFKVVLSAPRN